MHPASTHAVTQARRARAAGMRVPARQAWRLARGPAPARAACLLRPDAPPDGCAARLMRVGPARRRARKGRCPKPWRAPRRRIIARGGCPDHSRQPGSLPVADCRLCPQACGSSELPGARASVSGRFQPSSVAVSGREGAQ